MDNKDQDTQAIVDELNNLLFDFSSRIEKVFYKSPRTESGFLRYSLLSSAETIVRQIRDAYQDQLDKTENDTEHKKP